MVSDQAAARPGAVAVWAPDGRLTYGELEQRSGHLARQLQAHGVGPGSRVALCLDLSAALAVAALGVLKTGGAFVALDPSHPEERLSFMIRDCGAAVVIASEATAASIQDPRGTLVVLGPDAAQHDVPVSVARIRRSYDDCAYVIYTSGSSGRPKGVLVSHGGLVNLISWHQHAFAITESDRATQIASPGFDAAVWELWPYLACGASVRIVDAGARADPMAIRELIVAEQITVTFLPTVLAESVMRLDWPVQTCLRYLLTGGDALHCQPPPGLPFAVVNNYGPTEATVVATSGVVAPARQTMQAPSIGRPISNVRTYVVDEGMNQVERGATGELVIGGPGVALGYLGQPKLTAEKFVPDRFSRTRGGRLYRTGDYVRQRADGELEFRGRRDEQVQIRGSRVELSEISAALSRHPAVRTSVVGVDEAGSSAPRLVAYVVAGSSTDDAELRAHLTRELPSHMLPAAFVYLAELPLMPSGKVDRARLPAVGEPASSGSERPLSELEQVLESIVAELLGRDHVGAAENFFMLGGHSLLGAQLITHISQRFGIEMSLRSLFDNPTVAAMAVEVDQLLVAELEAMSDADADRLLAAGEPTALSSAGPPAAG